MIFQKARKPAKSGRPRFADSDRLLQVTIRLNARQRAVYARIGPLALRAWLDAQA